MRKAQSISINTIIVAAIALVVLIVLIVIFSQKSSQFYGSTESCEAVSGSCGDDSHTADKKSCKLPDWIKHPYAKCTEKISVGGKDEYVPCCIRIISPPKEPAAP